MRSPWTTDPSAEGWFIGQWAEYSTTVIGRLNFYFMGMNELLERVMMH